jgi:Flp pilus assembly protein TadG
MGVVRRLRFEERGQGMVELALLLPLLLILVFGIIDFARAFNYKDQATQVANETARWFIVDQLPVANGLNPANTTAYKNWAHDDLAGTELKNAAPAANIKICFTDQAGLAKASNPQAGDSVTVTIPASLTPVGYVGQTLGINAFQLTGKATMRIELTPLHAAAMVSDAGC